MREPVYRPIIWTARSLFAGLGLKFDIVGAENIPLAGGAVLAINHTSYLDFALAGIPADRRNHRLVRFMAKESIFRHPIAGPLMRGMKHIPVDRNAGSAAFRDAVADLRAGELVGVFPEATMSRSLEIKEIKNGAVRMARAANVPLIPMIVFGGHRIMSYDHRDLTRGRTIAMTVDEPLPTPRGTDPDEITNDLRARMSVLLDETIARYPDRPAGAWWIPARLGGGAPPLT
ncbi:MAG: 1-acyl-sn-glycerol-3-phosphate acyltransferase [Candidatus Nanopelagicales bacterium]|nr:1-acyl-sn-glycerol-3-phosphate acyltransferase [Candidatus Nanopelagicales bacterium]MCF8538412.1 1-acyl-sn-glycerol-3-phosphate acyltransferase [Candidatus Nanopelagicales bacterium]MCF8542886.1 1-acyl-sn-glycerol-3-phosphate acyltransferase [Candidatus Nanopelagicales bacterium]MCF8558144.1 1-acyl-sn-glycerol-3-phosphate acyltransferase [Candidatus Nanopelagicales bacterium]